MTRDRKGSGSDTPQGAFTGASKGKPAPAAADDGGEQGGDERATAPPQGAVPSGPLIPGVSFPPELNDLASGGTEVVLGDLLEDDGLSLDALRGGEQEVVLDSSASRAGASFGADAKTEDGPLAGFEPASGPNDETWPLGDMPTDEGAVQTGAANVVDPLPVTQPLHGRQAESARFHGETPLPEAVPSETPSVPTTATPGTHNKPTTPGPDRGGAPERGQEVVVLEEIAALDVARSSSSRPPPLGYAEEHDAWTVDRMSQKNTMRPEAGEVDRLVELSSLRMSDFPEELTPGSPLDLVDHARPSRELDLVGQMQELHALDDLTGALAVAELLLGREPGNRFALECAEDCRNRLVALYTSKLGRMDAIVVVALGDAELRWLGLDHRSGFLLSRVDGLATVDELLDVCGMPRLEALQTLADLLERGAIRLQ